MASAPSVSTFSMSHPHGEREQKKRALDDIHKFRERQRLEKIPYKREITPALGLDRTCVFLLLGIPSFLGHFL